MKALRWFAIIILVVSFYTSHAQVIVKVKPVAPRGAVIVPSGRAPHGKVWVSGHWVARGNNYYWQDGYYTNYRKGYRYVDGYWSKHRNGWVYVPGKWRRR